MLLQLKFEHSLMNNKADYLLTEISYDNNCEWSTMLSDTTLKLPTVMQRYNVV